MSETDAGRVGYEAYAVEGAGQTFDGRSMPTRDELGATPAGRTTRRRWEVAAAAICAHASTHTEVVIKTVEVTTTESGT